MQRMQKTADETTLNSPLEVDTCAFVWTFDCLDEDHKLKCFFSGLPGSHGPRMVRDPLPDLTSEQHRKLLNAWLGLFGPFSSDLLPVPVKIRRTDLCLKAIILADIN